MAKKKDAKKKNNSRADAVRAAVDQAFQATADRAEQTQKAAQDFAQDIADEVTQLLTRAREAVEDARPAQGGDVEALRAEIAALSARVAKLEGTAKPARRTPARKSTASKVPAARAATKRTTARKPAARKPAS